MNETWQALAREAGIAAEHMAMGVSALGKADHARHAYYGQAFFALTIGFERSAKLALVVDYAIEHEGVFPDHAVLRKHSHHLRGLLEHADGIASRRGIPDQYRLPRTPIHEGIVSVLSDFATNVTRYYNLDLVTGDPRARTQDDPIRAWFSRVTAPVLASHYRPRHRRQHECNAALMQQVLGPYTRVSHHAETGEPLSTLYEASLQTGVTNFAKPYTRMYVLQIARFLSVLLSELGHAGYQLSTPLVPHLSEFFAIFFNDDNYFKKRKVWSIYRR